MSRVTSMLESVRESLSEAEQAELAHLIYERLGAGDFTPLELTKIDRGLTDLEQGRVRPADEVMSEILRGIRKD